MKLVQRTLGQIDPPVGLVDDLRKTSKVQPVLDLAQGAPVHPPAPSVVERIREVALDPDGGRYTPGAGLPALRAAMAEDLSEDYGAEVGARNVLITAGSNQAFCLTASALAEAGDEVILSVPFYFNHDMWLRLDQLRPIYVDTDPTTGQVVVDRVAEGITSRTRLVVLTSPGNPTGVTGSPDLLDELADLTRDRGVVLVLDETYRAFRQAPGPPHRLLQRRDWTDYVVSLQSFSKDYALPGYRVGAVVGAPPLLDEVIKLMDCIAICAPRIGQEAALAGLRTARQWRADRAEEVAATHEKFKEVMAAAPGGFELQTSGGFYGWVRHPLSNMSGVEVVRRLAAECGLLTIPGDVFTPDVSAFIRVSFANVTEEGLEEFASRLEKF